MKNKTIAAPSSYLYPERHLDNLLGHDWYKTINALLSGIYIATTEFYVKKNIQPALFPVTTGAISSPMGLGSDSQPVSVKIKGHRVYLADSMQFCLEIGARLNSVGAYYIMPTFRGEETDARHLNEFMHSEVEIRGELNDVMALAEAYIKYLIRYLLKHNAAHISAVAGGTEHLSNALKHKFRKLSYSRALADLMPIEGAVRQLGRFYDITPKGEKILLQQYGDFVWLTDLPWKLVPFYQAKQEIFDECAYAADLLAGIGEILGCGQRVLTIEDLDASLKAHRVKPDEYQWYRRMREIECVQTSGFGLGIERFLLWVLKHDDIRDCTILLRNHNKIVGP
ncbi:MAG: asparaginase [Alphaproteobacteria bacterium]|nr:asparaginase [Alphaproteobacteria bacterium]